MTGALLDVDRIGTDELRGLLIEALGKVAGLTAENAALREEIARLKGLKGRELNDPFRTTMDQRLGRVMMTAEPGFQLSQFTYFVRISLREISAMDV
jgi:hypothetical protein